MFAIQRRGKNLKNPFRTREIQKSPPTPQKNKVRPPDLPGLRDPHLRSPFSSPFLSSFSGHHHHACRGENFCVPPSPREARWGEMGGETSLPVAWPPHLSKPPALLREIDKVVILHESFLFVSSAPPVYLAPPPPPTPNAKKLLARLLWEGGGKGGGCGDVQASPSFPYFFSGTLSKPRQIEA